MEKNRLFMTKQIVRGQERGPARVPVSAARAGTQFHDRKPASWKIFPFLRVDFRAARRRIAYTSAEKAELNAVG